ncbi:MAG: choice-of-anchor Q domain-containing protein [Thermoanaerobaculia bacterium]
MGFALRRIYWLPVYAALGFAGAGSALADVIFTVDSILDQIDDDTTDGICHTAADSCTLRAAVMQANAVSGAGATIHLAATTYTLIRPAAGADGSDNGDLNLTTPASGDPVISIVGMGETVTIVDANDIDRVLSVAADRTAILSRLTLRNGFLNSALLQDGAGIANDGSLTLNHCTVADNVLASVARRGGGIFSSAGSTLHLNDSTVSGNTTAGSGGGIQSLSSLFLDRSTVDGNTAQAGGGGVVSVSAALTITGSTISRNTSHLFGGGIISLGETATLIVTNSTITLNNADGDAGGISAANANIYSSTIAFNGADADHDEVGGLGGGIYVDGGGPFNIANTLVVGNTLMDTFSYDDCFGPVTSYRRNLFSEVNATCSISIASGDGWGFLNSLALLGELGPNGGPTATRALLPGSNAIDGGDSTLGCTGPTSGVLATDQRGAARTHGARCDVGAYEAGSLFFDGFESGDLAAW